MTMFVYVAASSDGLVKIGSSNNPRLRKSWLKCVYGKEFEIRFVGKALNAGRGHAIERLAHFFLVSKHLGRELYRVSVDRAVKEVLRAACALGYGFAEGGMNYVSNQRFARKGEYQRLVMRFKRAKDRKERTAALRELRAAFPDTQVGKRRR